jgi:hypothetical protein
MAGGALGPPAARWLGRRAGHNAGGRPRHRYPPAVRTKLSSAWTAVGAGFGRLAAATPPSKSRAGSTASQSAAGDPLTTHCVGRPAAPGPIGVLVGQASTICTTTTASTPATARLTATRCRAAGAWPAASESVRVRRMAQSGRICPPAPATGDHDRAATHWPQVAGWVVIGSSLACRRRWTMRHRRWCGALWPAGRRPGLRPLGGGVAGAARRPAGRRRG